MRCAVSGFAEGVGDPPPHRSALAQRATVPEKLIDHDVSRVVHTERVPLSFPAMSRRRSHQQNRRRQTSRKFSAPSNKEKPRQFGGAAFWFAPGAGGIVTGANAYGDAGGPGLSIIPTLPANHSTPPMRQCVN
jgi:hypothetical protein